MIITLPTGEYIREPKNTLVELSWISEALEDWPGKPLDISKFSQDISKCARISVLSKCRNNINYSFDKMYLIFCSPQHERLGVLIFSTKGLDTYHGVINLLAIHPDYRDQGYFSKLAAILIAFLNQTLKLDYAEIEVVDGVEQILYKVSQLDASLVASYNTNYGTFVHRIRLDFEEVDANAKSLVPSFESVIPAVLLDDRIAKRGDSVPKKGGERMARRTPPNRRPNT